MLNPAPAEGQQRMRHSAEIEILAKSEGCPALMAYQYAELCADDRDGRELFTAQSVASKHTTRYVL